MVTRRTFTDVFLLAAFAVVIYLMFRILQPFLLSIFLTVVLFALLGPVHQKILVWLNHRNNLTALRKPWAAAVSKLPTTLALVTSRNVSTNIVS